MSFCSTSLRNFIQIGPPSAEKNEVMSIFKMAYIRHLKLYGFNNGFLEKPSWIYITSYSSSIDIIALNCLVFEKIAFFCIVETDKQTDKQMDIIDSWSRSLAISSCGLINRRTPTYLDLLTWSLVVSLTSLFSNCLELRNLNASSLPYDAVYTPKRWQFAYLYYTRLSCRQVPGKSRPT